MENKNNTYEEFNKYLNLAIIGDGMGKLKVIEMLNPLIIASIKRYCPIMREFDDLYSDGVEIVLRLIETYDGKRSFLKYAKSYLKYHYLKTFTYLLEVEEDIHEDEENKIFETIASCDNIEEDFLDKEEEGVLKEAIDRLTDRQRQVIVLYYYERLGLSEIATYLGISKWTVVNLKRNAVENLKKQLKHWK
jgi:RNA polymerase sigma factor (sigma-70 family)